MYVEAGERGILGKSVSGFLLEKITEVGRACCTLGWQSTGAFQNSSLLSICYVLGSVLNAAGVEKDLKKAFPLRCSWSSEEERHMKKCLCIKSAELI